MDITRNLDFFKKKMYYEKSRFFLNVKLKFIFLIKPKKKHSGTNFYVGVWFPPHHQWAILRQHLGVLQFNSDTVYPETASNPTSWVLSPTKQLPLKCQSQVHVVTCTSDQPAIIQTPTTLSLLGFNLLDQLTELRKPIYSPDGVAYYWRY